MNTGAGLHEYLSACPVCSRSVNGRTIYTQKYSQLISGTTDFEVHICQCQHCGFVFQNPQPSAATLATYYSTETFSLAYERGSKEIPKTMRNRFRRVIALWDSVGVHPHGPVLDVGCHTGQFLSYLKGIRVECSGHEISARAARVGREWYNVNINEGGIRSMDHLYAPESFDLVTAFHLVEHLIDIPAFLENAWRILKPEGILNIEVPDITRVPKGYANYFYIEHLSYFSLDTLDYLLRRWGFEKIVSEQIPADYPDDQGWGMPSIIAVYRKGEAKKLDVQTQSVSEGKLESMRETIIELNLKVKFIKKVLRGLKSYRKVFIWGSGSHTLFLKGLNELTNATAVIDSNEIKWGQSTIGLPIISPQEAARVITSEDTVLISSYSGEEAILRDASKLFPGITLTCLYQ